MRQFIAQIKRFFYWGWTMRNNYDFDYSYVEQMLLLKLQRLLHTMNTDPCHMNLQDLIEMRDSKDSSDFDKHWAIGAIKSHKALIRAVNILERITHETYYDDKVGLTAYYEQNPVTFENFNERTEDSRIEYIQKIKPMHEHKERLIDRDKKLLYTILYKYGNHWWT